MEAAAMTAYLLGFLAIAKSFIPAEFYLFLDDLKKKLFKKVSWYYTVEIHSEDELERNQLYSSTTRYLGTIAYRAASSVQARSSQHSNDIRFRMAPSQALMDEYKGLEVCWKYFVQEPKERDGFRSRTKKSYELRVKKKDKHIVEDYLRFILQRGQELALHDREKHLYTNMRDYWTSVPFKPPATFETLAMEPAMKEKLVRDLIAFKNGKDFYTGVGRAWKRGYLLHGPPGTGKSSLIAAIANLTEYDVYDLELTKVRSNTELRQLLIKINDRAIVVVEDIDCSLEFENRALKKSKGRSGPFGDDETNIEGKSEVTLSGFLNFTDGLWSSCGSEKLFIFTTNYIERLDPALLRPGRMDFKVDMSYCSFEVFKILSANYLKVSDHQLFMEIKELLQTVKITPAHLIEVLLEHHSDTDLALERLVGVLKAKTLENKNIGEEVNAFNREEITDLTGFSSSDAEKID